MSKDHSSRVLNVELEENENPIFGLNATPLLSLEEACKKAQADKELAQVPLEGPIFLARGAAKKRLANNIASHLSEDEIAAIHLYTQETDFYRILNSRLRDPLRQRLKPFLFYIKLVLTALYKLPPVAATVYRGVKKDLSNQFSRGRSIIWWSFSSTAASVETMNEDSFLGQDGDRTMFHIVINDGVDISKLSALEAEEEILLLPGTCVEVQGVFQAAPGLHIVQMQQVPLSGLLDFTRSSLPSFPSSLPSPSQDQRATSQPPVSSSLQALSLDSSSSFSFTRDYSAVRNVVSTIGSSGSGNLQLDRPRGMAVGDNDRIFLADRDNHRIQCFDSQGNFIFTLGTFGTGKGEFNWPVDVAFDSKNQRILVADSYNHRFQAFDVDGTFLFSFGSKGKATGEFNQPSGITTDKVGNIFVSDNENHRVQEFDGNGNFLREFGSYGTGQGELKSPIGVGILSNGDVVVADHGNQRLCVFNSQGQYIQLIGEDYLSDPQWLFIDSQDNILVADNGNKSFLFFSKEGKLLKEIGKDLFRNAWGVVMNRKGDIFVSGKGQDKQYRIFAF